MTRRGSTKHIKTHQNTHENIAKARWKSGSEADTVLEMGREWTTCQKIRKSSIRHRAKYKANPKQNHQQHHVG